MARAGAKKPAFVDANRATTTTGSNATSPSTPSTPAISHGVAHEVGSLEEGKWADIVIWRPAFFGVKPSMILKGGSDCLGLMGDANASIPTPQPVHGRPMFGAFGKTVQSSSLTFVSQAAMKLGVAKSMASDKQVAAVKNIRRSASRTWS